MKDELPGYYWLFDRNGTCYYPSEAILLDGKLIEHWGKFPWFTCRTVAIYRKVPHGK